MNTVSNVIPNMIPIDIPDEYFDEVFDNYEVKELKKTILEFDTSGELQELIFQYGSTVLELTYAKTMGIKITNKEIAS